MHLVLAPPSGGHLPGLAACHQAFVGHELPNRLVALQGFARLLAAGGLHADEARDMAARLAAIARRTDEAARRLADIGRVLREPPWGLPVSPAAEAHDAAAEANALLPDAALSVSADGGGLTVACSGRLLRRVFRELLLNSARTRPGVTARVTARPDGAACRIAVADDGPGLAEDQARLLLEPFAASRQSENAGPGLGFFLVRSVAALWGAAVEVFTEPGRGLRVELCIPPGPQDVR